MIDTMTPEEQRTEWLAWRRQGIGGSDAAAVLGLSPFVSPLTLFLDKTGKLPPSEGSAAMTWGSKLEDVVVQAFEEKTGLLVRNRQAQVVHPDYDWMRTTIDGDVYDLADTSIWTLEALKGLFEGKTANAYSRDEWADAPPIHVQLQVQHNMAVTGLPKAWVAVLLGGQDFRVYEIERDDLLIADLIEAERRFWHEYVLKGVLPPASESSAEADALKRAFGGGGGETELPEEVLELIEQRQEAYRVRTEAEAKQTWAENQIKALLGDAEIGKVNGHQVVTLKIQRMPERVMKATEFRVLRFPKIKEEATA